MMDWINPWIGERTSWDGGVLIVMGLIVLFATNPLNLSLFLIIYGAWTIRKAE